MEPTPPQKSDVAWAGIGESPIDRARILIVDDHEANVILMRRILRSDGFTHVRGISDSRDALACSRTWDPDLIILDLHMPHLGGTDFLRVLRRNTPPSDFVPVLVVTADTTHDALTRSFAAGANDYVTKPVDTDEILVRVRNLLSIRLAHENLKRHNQSLAAVIRVRARSGDRRRARDERIEAIRSVLDSGGPDIVFQPVVDLSTRTPIGVEALSRFGDSDRPPERWFADATMLGLGIELEAAALANALDRLGAVPAGQTMSVNLSAAALLSPLVADLLDAAPLDRLIIELSEDLPVDDLPALRASMATLRRRGARIAVDDARGSYDGLHRTIELHPDVIKIDIELTRDIDSDPAKRALATALVRSAGWIGASVVAEGIETGPELATLIDMGVGVGQGDHLGPTSSTPVPAVTLPAPR